MASYPGRFSDPSTATAKGFVGWSPETDVESAGYTPTAARPEPGTPTNVQRRKQRQLPSSPGSTDLNDVG